MNIDGKSLNSRFFLKERRRAKMDDMFDEYGDSPLLGNCAYHKCGQYVYRWEHHELHWNAEEQKDEWYHGECLRKKRNEEGW